MHRSFECSTTESAVVKKQLTGHTAAHGGDLPRWSTPWNQPAKWNGIQATPLPTRSVTSAFTRTLELFSGPVTQTQPPSLMPRAAASAGLISTNMSCCNSASHGLERV